MTPGRIRAWAGAAVLAITAATPAQAGGNLASNAELDTDLASWTLFAPGEGSAVWDPLDAAMSMSSGSALVTNTSSTGDEAILQCIAVSPSEALRFDASIRLPSGQAGTGSALLSATWHDDATCSTASTPAGVSPQPMSFDAWETLGFDAVSPASASSVTVFATVQKFSGTDFSAHFDAIFVPEPSARALAGVVLVAIAALRRVGARRAAIGLGLALLAVAPGRAAADDPFPLHDALDKGRQHLAVVAGYGHGFTLGTGASGSRKSQLLAVVPSWGIGLSDVVGQDAWYRGSWQFVVETQLLGAFEPEGGFGGGLVLNLRYPFRRWERIVPFVELGAGIGAIEFDLDGQRDGFEFYLQGSTGFHAFLSESLAWTTLLRYHHISNAQTRRPNGGINSFQLLTGPTFFLD